MKKILIFCIFATLPFLSLAQDAPLVKDFYKGIKAIPTSFILNDHVNIMQFNLDDENFDVTAINDKVQILWKTTLKGHVISTSKFKDKILAVAAGDFSKVKGTNNTFKGYIIDPATGKVLIEKVIYDGPQDYMTFPYVFTGEGEGQYFKFAVRQSAYKARTSVFIASIFISIPGDAFNGQLNETKDLDVIDFNEKLQPINKIKPIITDGTFITLNCNKAGDMFIGWLKNGNISIAKYGFGEKIPASELTGNVVLMHEAFRGIGLIADRVFITPSKTNNNILYYALTYVNKDNNKQELGVGKLNFLTGKTQFTNETFTNDHIKELKKAYLTVNKDFNSPELGPTKELNVRAFSEIDNHLYISLSSTSLSKGSMGYWESEYSILLNNYDTDLNLKFQQLIPTSYSVPERHLPTGYYHSNNKLFVIANHKVGFTSLYAAYCVIDLASGKCDKLTLLSKKNLGIADSSAVLWFNDSFVVPYINLKGLSGNKYDVTLQQNSY